MTERIALLFSKIPNSKIKISKYKKYNWQLIGNIQAFSTLGSIFFVFDFLKEKSFSRLLKSLFPKNLAYIVGDW